MGAIEALRARQREALLALLREVVPANPFYRRKLGPQVPEIGAMASLTLPFTTKQELCDDQRQHPPFGTNLTHPLDRYTRCHQTSGTSGFPLRWLDTPESWEAMIASWQSIFAAAGLLGRDRIFFAFSFGPFIGFWLAFEAAARLGGLCLPGGGMSSAARLRTILDLQATVLCCTPTYALRLAEVAGQERIDLSQSAVRLLLVAGEPGGSIPETRRRLEQAWPGARVFDHHGMTEVGPVTFECPAHPTRLHLLEEAYWPEIMDPVSLQPVEPGAAGELILTTLRRAAAPLIRYRTGDLVRWSEGPCPCGRLERALEGGILGRVDDMVVVRGVNIYPSSVDALVLGTGGVAEYQAVVDTRPTLPELRLQVEPAPGANPGLLTRELQSRLENSFSLRVRVELVASLPRFEMKARRWKVEK